MVHRYLPLACILSLLSLAAAPARADHDDVHYYLTYAVARMAGYTPEQAYRVAAADLCVNASETTEPRRFDTVDALAGLNPNERARQLVRWTFHGFAFTAVPAGANQEEMGFENRKQLRDMGRNDLNRNPGVLIHLRLDSFLHQDLTSDFGKHLYATAVSDWLASHDQAEMEDMVCEIYLLLREFMAHMAPQQRLSRWNAEEFRTSGMARGLATAFIAANPAPQLTTDQRNLYTHWLLSKLNPGATAPELTTEQTALFERVRQGPDMKAARAALEGVPEALPDHTVARKQFRYDGTGSIRPEMSDSFVLTGSLRVTLAGADGEPQEPVEMVIKGPARSKQDEEYALTRPAQLNVPGRGTWENLPIGDVIVEVRRGGQVVARQEGVKLDKRENEVTVEVGAAQPMVWKLKAGFPKIDPAGNELKREGFGEVFEVTSLEPTRLAKRITTREQHTYAFQYALSQAPPAELRSGQTTDIKIVGTAQGPGGGELWSHVEIYGGYGMVAFTDTGPRYANQRLSLARLGNQQGKWVAAASETVHLTPGDRATVELELSLDGLYLIRWEWEQTEGPPAGGQQPTPPTQPGTPQQPAQPGVEPQTPTPPAPPARQTGQGAPMGINVAVQQGADGKPEVVIASIADDSPMWFLQPGTVIVSLDGIEVTSAEQVRGILGAKKGGDQLDMRLRVGGQIQVMKYRVDQ